MNLDSFLSFKMLNLSYLILSTQQSEKLEINLSLISMDKIAELLKKMAGVSDKDIELFIFLHEHLTLKKHDFLLTEGQVENYLYFIKDGLIRCFTTKEHQNTFKEFTFNLVFPGWFFSSYESFIMRQPCTYSTECLTDVEVYRISYTNLQRVYKETKAGEMIGRLAAEQLYINKSKREISLLTYSVDERYKYLLKTYPNHLHDIPLKYIASYIGVTPQALSKVRKRVFKEIE